MRSLAMMLMLAALGGTAMAEADGPDFFRVTGVAADDMLNLRTGPGAGHEKIGEIPPDADGLANLGCEGGLSFAEWEKASLEERAAAARDRWCRVRHDGTEGWVAARFLAEGSAPPTTLEGTEWRLLASPAGPAIAEAWIAFRPDGTVTGNAGCNGFRGRGRFGPGSFSMEGPIAATRKICGEPGVMAQEGAVLDALGRAAGFAFDLRTGTLRIMDIRDETLLELVPRR